MTALLAPPVTAPGRVEAALRRDGRAVLAPAGLPEALGVSAADLEPLRRFWNDLPPDAYLRDGGRYRRRRHSCFIVEGGDVTRVPHRAHWQPLEYNALHGGLQRWFEPVDTAMLEAPAWSRLLAGIGAVCSVLTVTAHRPVPTRRWFVEAHPFRIDTTDGIGRPTPEGAHRDGVDFVAVLLVARQGVKGGETRVFEAGGPHGLRFTMLEPWTLLLLDDARVVHETTPIQPLEAGQGHRDTLVLTYRAGGFQGP